MKKITVILLMIFCVNFGYSSKLSKYLNKMEDRQAQRNAQEYQQDMNFGDFVFRLKDRYTDNHGARCRNYEFRSRSNPYKHGFFTVCEDS